MGYYYSVELEKVLGELNLEGFDVLNWVYIDPGRVEVEYLDGTRESFEVKGDE